ncbi:hypothetical protein BJ742DRAFT_672819 [Cladochytrium replicatum]|nr:hypothetical protein BJ742DRAFT_672819 [Cladochytrium replicatum]
MGPGPRNWGSGPGGKPYVQEPQQDYQDEIEICAGCNKEIVDENDAFEIEALQKLFHVDCFRCCVCNVVFSDDVPYIPHNGEAYCETHYEEVVFTPTCFGCKKPIFERPVHALGRVWHAEHLICAACQKPIQGNLFEHNGNVYCAADYARQVAPTCRACNRPIQGETICALGGTFHVQCFRCAMCGTGFPDKTFYVNEDLPYCRQHYHERNNSLCGGCGRPIEGPCAEIGELGKRFHPPCWSCGICREPLTATYYAYMGVSYCERDIVHVYNSAKAQKASKRRTLLTNI